MINLYCECMILPDTDILEGLIFELDPVDNSVKLLELKQCKILYLSMSQKKELMNLYQRFLITFRSASWFMTSVSWFNIT